MTAEPASYRCSARTELKRRPQRGRYDKAAVHAVLDANALCHIGYLIGGRPRMLPTIYWRTGERIFWHGSRQSQALSAMAGAEVCLCVSRLEALVLGRSAFRHSANYRSVVAFGRAHQLDGDADKLAALEGMIERLYPGRWAQVRPPSAAELAAVNVLFLQLDEVSAKTRTGPPVDLDADLDIPVWAGVAPIELRAGALEPCPRLIAGAAPPGPLVDWQVLGSTDG
jgi:nitroimidazol reductase NimA-like FMN-containing flavoprotein (pyridoxamine 5'-phosphate oxidase superfamily)